MEAFISYHKRWQAAFLVLLLTLCLFMSSCKTAEKKVSKNGFYFDTIITITLYGTEDSSYIDDCFQLADNYEHTFSNTIKDSDISKINAADGSFVTVSEETIALLQDAMEYCNISNGKFDVTIGELSDLWNFSEIAKNLQSVDNEADPSVLPDGKSIQEALSHVDYENIEIRDSRVRLKDPKAKLDVGGIAKGFIADKIKEYLNQQGITRGVISLGGNVLTLGQKKDGVYTIGIQKPFAETGTALAALSVKDASVVTSGIYERYYRINGKLYHHILDTATGYPVDNNLQQVTIISKSSMDGDALSTTCFALGLDKGMALIEHTNGVEAVFVTDDGKIHQSSGIGGDSGISLKIY